MKGCLREGCYKDAKWEVQLMTAYGYRVPLCEEHAKEELDSISAEFEEPYAIPMEEVE